MKRVWTAACLAILTALAQAPLGAQNMPNVVAYAIDSADAGGYVLQTVNDLVFSFILELRTYKVTDLRKDIPPEDLSVPAGADYLFYGNLSNQPNGVRLELVLRGGPQDITRKISRVFENSNRVLLESRMLVRDLFDLTVSLPDPAVTPPLRDSAVAAIAPPTLDSLSGTWSGEQGVEKILILRGGRGVMVLSSGVSISLTLEYRDGTLVVRQKGALNPRQFLDLPDAVAREAAQSLPPLEWDLTSLGDRDTLTGIRKTVRVTHNGDSIVDTTPEDVPVEWKRL